MRRTLCRFAITAAAAAALAFAGAPAAMAHGGDDMGGGSGTFFKTSTSQAGPLGAANTYTVSYAN
ncbi:hypothetical protein [Planomonospora venezuelensis]|uniref:Pectate lyase n=1 Tax=Planomonospora venezuelensis TaxID=1999 RepID=A0A841D671_PLAVE|nr:hypothetical protein [Planomonospora venezuelensis]MBB5962946.1 hypothetical protein [Planomonospora venezuelensis]GIN04563.1 hypothetical protein Pve01_62210 [Planomonospora venezuelensis]